MRCLEAATVQCLLCRGRGFPGRATGAAAGGKREAEVQCPWPPLTPLEQLHFYLLYQLKSIMITFE